MYTLIVRDMDSFGMYEDVFEYKTFEDLFAAYEGHSDSRLNPLMRVEDASSAEKFVWCEGEYHNEQPAEFTEMFFIRYTDSVTGEYIEEEASTYSGLKEIAKKAPTESMFIITIIDNNGYEHEYDYNSWEEM